MLTGKTRPPSAAELAAARQVIARQDPDLVAAITVVVRSEVRPVVRRVGRELAAWLLLITLVTGVGMWRTEAAVDRVGRESVERQVESCRLGNEFRRFLRDDYARRGRPLDVEAIRAAPEYQALPLDVRPFVDALIAQTVADRGEAADQGADYSEQFPIVSCDALRRQLEGGG